MKPIICGIDEAGRGPWAGPVVAAAVILPRGFHGRGIDDSKKLTAAEREVAYARIMAKAIVGIGAASVREIDHLNILQATFLAMSRAHAALAARGGAATLALIDGNRLPHRFPIDARAIIEGDAKERAIAAASIVAKVTRDRAMTRLHQNYPQYGWAENKGYGTPFHQQALAAHGVTLHHRQSWAPLRQLSLL